MKIFRTIGMAFAMFSSIPMPRLDWNGGNMRYMLCAFPLVGLVIGLTLWGWIALCGIMGFGTLLFAVGLTLIPVLVTGGIHLDGFCDTVDALASHAPLEKKRDIFKDPHTGAFAVIGVGIYLLLYFGIATELKPNMNTVLLLTLMHGITRVATGLSVIVFPSSQSKGLLDTFRESADKKRAAIILLSLLILFLSALIWVDWLSGAAIIVMLFGCGVYLYFMSRREFGGMSGDLAGYFLQLSEICMLGSLVLVQKGVMG